MSGQLDSIYVAPVKGAPMQPVDEVRAVPGRGLEGDRYFADAGTFKKDPGNEVTLVESEAIAALNSEGNLKIGFGDARRNLITAGVRLNELVGRRFRVGSIVLEGVKLCHPCGYLEGLTVAGVKPGLTDRGGLRARIIEEGVIHAGDPIEIEDEDV